MIAAAATRGDVMVTNIIPKHMESLSAKLEEMGVGVEEYDEAIRIYVDKPELKRANVKTQPYPGFPTDLQPQMLTLLTVAKGTSIMKENVWDNRFKYIDELNRMAALIADGVTEIYNLQYIDRGYENLEEKLRALGAQITRRNVNPMPGVLSAVNV